MIQEGMNSSVTQIKERLSIEEVVSSYLKLEKAGSNFRARCPFHNEKTPSFFVSPDRGNYYCFGCGAKGDIFTFVEEFEGLDFKGALKLLADRAGVTLASFNREKETEKERLFRAMEEATKYFEANLKKEEKVLAYLKKRGLTDASISDFRIGYAGVDWRELYFYLSKLGFSELELDRAGLIKKSEKGYYDRFRGRIMFPISDSSGRVIAFSGRLFIDDGKSAKYLNSPDTPIFSKSAVLYALDKAKDSIRKNNFSILVEGQFDLVLSHQAGYRNTVATSGTALSDSTVSKENVVSNLGLLRRLSSNLVLAFDADKAGENASKRASRIALGFGMDVKAAILPEGVDPADLISQEGPEAWKSAIRNSKHIIEFLLNKILAKKNQDPRYLGREIKNIVLPYVNDLESSIEKAHFIKLISDKTAIPENALKEDLEKVVAEEAKEGSKFNEKEEKKRRKDYIERRLLGIILWQKEKEKPVFSVDPVLEEYASILKQNKEDVIQNLNKDDLIFEAEVFYGEDANLEKDVQELLNNLKEESLKEELFKKMSELYAAELAKDSLKSKEILTEINEINKQIECIKFGRIKN